MLDAVIVGGGLAGLSCAVRMEAAGANIRLLEAEEAPGGRVRTDVVDGFRFDRGFQILLTGYPALQGLIDLPGLRPKKFSSGALVRYGEKFHHFADPFRDSMGAAIALAFDPIITLKDKLLVARLRLHVGKGTVADLFTRDEATTREYLVSYGFSPAMIERFFEPFFAGVFLEKQLVTSSRFFEFLFRMFATSDAVVPEQGIEMLPRQLAVRLRAESMVVNARVTRIRRERAGFTVETGSGASFAARTLVLALPDPQVRGLLDGISGRAKLAKDVQWNRTTTFYYSSHRTPVADPILMLNGEGTKAGPVNNAAVMSRVSSAYAPPGAHLVAASVVGQAPEAQASMEKLESEVRQHLEKWFGPDVSRWEVLAGYPIAQALPLCRSALWLQSATRLSDGVYVCGDYRELPSTQGALASGVRAAEAALRQLR